VIIGNKVVIMDKRTNYPEGQSFRVRPILNQFNISLEFIGLPQVDPYLSSNYSLKLGINNIMSVQWRFANISSSQKSFNFSTTTLGKNILCVNATIFQGFIRSYCKDVFVVLNYFKNVNTILTQAQYHNVTLPNIKIPIGPLAPNDNGNSYMIYSQIALNYLNVIELYPNGSIVKGSECNLTRKGHAFDIIATPWGFAVYFRYDPQIDRAAVIGVYKNCTVIYEKTIMNNKYANGTLAKVAIDQVLDGNKFGMEIMFNPSVGRLAYGRGRLGVLFGYYNQFTLSVHQGVSFITLDAKTGEDIKLGYPWGVSHSWEFSNVWDGEKFIHSARTDAGLNPHFFICQSGVSNTDCFTTTFIDNSSIVSGATDGFGRYTEKTLSQDDVSGCASEKGTNAGVLALNNTDYVIVYSRFFQNTSILGWNSNTKNHRNAINLMFVNGSRILKKEISIANGTNNSELYFARYGKNILVGYSISNWNCVQYSNVYKDYVNPPHKYYLKLVDLDGKSLGEISVNNLKSFQVLADGRVVWVTNEGDNSLVYHYLTPPGQ